MRIYWNNNFWVFRLFIRKKTKMKKEILELIFDKEVICRFSKLACLTFLFIVDTIFKILAMYVVINASIYFYRLHLLW